MERVRPVEVKPALEDEALGGAGLDVTWGENEQGRSCQSDE